MQKMDDWSAREIAARVARRELSAEAVARAFVERVEALEPGILAWQHFDAAQVVAQAQAVDRAGAQGAMAGVPIAVKDLIDTADMPTTYGSPIYAGHRPAVDAAVVASAREAFDHALALRGVALRCRTALVVRFLPASGGDAGSGWKPHDG